MFFYFRVFCDHQTWFLFLFFYHVFDDLQCSSPVPSLLLSLHLVLLCQTFLPYSAAQTETRKPPVKEMQIYAQAKAGPCVFWWKRSMRKARSYASSHSLSLFLSIATYPPPHPRLNLSPSPSFLFYNGLTLICMQMCPSSIPLIVWLPAVSVCVCVLQRLSSPH